MAIALTRPHPRTDLAIAQAIRDAGIVGAGGAGFPTYVKYAKPTPFLLVNCAESEPGYYGDKLIAQEHARELARLFILLKDIEAYERIIVGAEEGAKPYLVALERLADSTEAFEVVYFENLYKYGQERALIKRILGIEVPQKAIPPSVGVTVNNIETLWNIHQALIAGAPVTTKFVTVYGETPTHACFEAPVGAYATDLIALAGHATPNARYHLYDGGPVLCDEIPDWTREPYGIKRTTNGLLLVSPDLKSRRARSYPKRDGPPPPTRTEDIVGVIQRVRIPLAGGYGRPAKPVVTVGDFVGRGAVIGEASPHELSVPAHASIHGRVAEVTAEHVELRAPDPGVWWT